MSPIIRSPVSKRKKNNSSIQRRRGDTATPPTAPPSVTGSDSASETPHSTNKPRGSTCERQSQQNERGDGSVSAGATEGQPGEELPGLSTGATGMTTTIKTVGKLSDVAYQPWGTNSNPTSRTNSDVGSDPDKAMCKVGPGRKTW